MEKIPKVMIAVQTERKTENDVEETIKKLRKYVISRESMCFFCDTTMFAEVPENCNRNKRELRKLIEWIGILEETDIFIIRDRDLQDPNLRTLFDIAVRYGKEVLNIDRTVFDSL